MPNLPGFMRRTTARGEDGEWIVVTLWDTAADAEAAEELAEEHDVTQLYASFVDQSTVHRARYTTLD
ncbi:MAG TPA: hypothetical protein VFA34_07675 [Actinomycetota bacterium]|jgi:heme-degrading monooxygenase HmoA|nr:hypothetical protein [Actinomycetota bacterium]